MKIVEETRQRVDADGDEVSLGNLAVGIPAGAVAEDATLVMAEVRPNSLPVEPPDDLVGEVYALEWGTGSASSNTEKITVTLSYDPESLPDDASEEEMVITTFDGAEWLQLPTRVDSRKHELTAEVRHFSFFGALWDASGLGWWETTCDIHFYGQVIYENGRYPGDPRATTIPAATMGYAIVDADGILLHEGFLEPDGSFDFVLQEGVNVGFGVNPFLRVYAESPIAGKVKSTTALGAGVITYHGQVVEYDDYHCPSDVDLSIRIPLEESAVFKILQSVYLGLATAIGIDGSLDLPNPTVIWGGAGDYAVKTTDTGFKTFNDGQDTFIYIGNDPQVAWDEDVILSAYGQYLLYWLYDQESLPCTVRLGEVGRRVSACSAWAEGFGMYFSALARGDSVYESYQFEDINPISYDLDADQFSSDQRSPGAVAQALWELTSGGMVEVNVERLFQLLREQKTSIASLEDLYNHWDITYGLTRQECLIFAGKDIVDEEECGDDFVSEEPEQDEDEDKPVINRHTIEYGTSTSSTLAWEGRDIWRFEGSADDVISIKILAIDEDLDLWVTLTQAWNNKIVDDTVIVEEDGYWEWQARLENDGEHFLLVDAYDSEGQYSIDLELMEDWIDDEETSTDEDFSPSGETAGEIQYGQTVSGDIYEGDIIEWKFAGQAGEVVSFCLWSEDEDFQPYLYFGEDSRSVILKETGPGDPDSEYAYEACIMRYSLPEDGLYFIGVESTNGDGYYRLTVRLDEENDEEAAPGADEPSTGAGDAAGTLYDEIDLGDVHYSDGATSFDFHVPVNYTRVEVGCYDVASDERNYTQYCGWKGELQLNGDYVYDWVDWNSSDGGIYHNYILDEDVKTAHIDDSGFLDLTPMILSGVNTLTLDHSNEGAGIGMVVRIYTE